MLAVERIEARTPNDLLGQDPLPDQALRCSADTFLRSVSYESMQFSAADFKLSGC